MRPALVLAVAAALVAGALAMARAEEESDAPISRLVTLFANDPVSHTLNLATGRFGARIDGPRLIEGKAHADYACYGDDVLTFALDDDDRGTAIDLGHWADLARVYDFPEADGGGIGYASISFDGSDLRIARRVPRDGFQVLREGRALLATTTAGERRVAVHPVPGHVYLVRIEDRQRRSPAVYAKILVVSHVPSDRVTLRWDRIPGL